MILETLRIHRSVVDSQAISVGSVSGEKIRTHIHINMIRSIEVKQLITVLGAAIAKYEAGLITFVLARASKEELQEEIAQARGDALLARLIAEMLLSEPFKGKTIEMHDIQGKVIERLRDNTDQLPNYLARMRAMDRDIRKEAAALRRKS